jgi:predicted ATP-grasp superfamily ATP-dependent carboligase
MPDILQNAPRDGALVIDGGGHGVLAIARSLGRRRIPVWVASNQLPLATHSRYTQASLPWPASLTMQQQAEHLVELARCSRLDGWVLIAASDESAELLGRYREVLAPIFRFSTSSWEVVRDAVDKRRSYALAQRAGVSHPKTSYPQNVDELMRAETDFPAILKPAVKDRSNALTQAKAWKVRNRDQLIRRYREALTMMAPGAIMLQELIPGGNENQYSYAALCRDGASVASLVARRLRQYPVEFGRSSSLVETIDLPEVEDCARRLLGAMGFSGIVEVEFKRDPRDGELKLLDINPRAWRWMSLGPRVGVDFPYLLYRQCRGEPIQPLKGVAGVRWVRMATDPIAAAIEIWRGATTARTYFRSLRPPIEFSLLARDDPLPALFEIPQLIAIELRRVGLLRPKW